METSKNQKNKKYKIFFARNIDLEKVGCMIFIGREKEVIKMSSVIFGIDHGNGNIKTEHMVFPCGFVRQGIQPKECFGRNVLKYKGNYYMLSDTRMPYKADKTTDLDYFILTLFALAEESVKQEINLNGKDVILSIGLPPADYAFQHEKFKKYFFNEMKNGIAFSFNGKNTMAYLKDVQVTPQNYAAVMCLKQQVIQKYRTVFCVDIGDGTVDLLAIKKGRPDLKVCVSLKFGIAVMRSEIINIIQQDFGFQLDSDTVEQVLMQEENVLPKEIVFRIQEIAKEWTWKIINELHSYVPDFRINPTVFCGGGAGLLKEYLEESKAFGLTEYIEDIKANAIGYQMIAESKEKKKGLA